MTLKIDIPDCSLLFHKDKIRQALRAGAKLVVTEARALTRNAGGSGRAYSTPASVGKGVHYASAPYEPPAALTGQLSGSITTKMGRNGDSIKIVDTALNPHDGKPYSVFLEKGAAGGGGNPKKGHPGTRNKKEWRKQLAAIPSTQRELKPRPFLTRARADQDDAIRQKLSDALQDAFDLALGK